MIKSMACIATIRTSTRKQFIIEAKKMIKKEAKTGSQLLKIIIVSVSAEHISIA